MLIKDIGKYEKSGKVSKRVIEELKSILGINNCIEEYKRYLSYAKLMKVSPHTRDFSHELGDTI